MLNGFVNKCGKGVGLWLAGWLLLLGSGCGTKTYEERLEMTRTYYDYVDRLNRNLGTQFSGSGVIMRLPIQFQEVPPPPRKPPTPTAEGAEEAAPESEASEPDERDSRLPERIDFELPGLIAVWKAPLATLSEGGDSTESKTGYIYLLGNYEYWLKFKTPREIGDPLEFYDELIDTLAAGLEIPIDRRAAGSASDRVNKWFVEQTPAPADEQFVPKKDFRTITLVPEPTDDDQPKREYQLYMYEAGDMKVAVLYDLPGNVSGGEKIQDRILLSLQTINVSPEKPRRVAGDAPKPDAGGAAF